MRRLRGEQFCSVEHLDLFSAQQAELALERLAASADEKPVTERPAPVLKRLSREPQRQETQHLEPPPPEPTPIEATPELQPLADALNYSAEAGDEVEATQDEADAAFSRLMEAFPAEPAAPPPAPAISPKPVPEYPLAAFVSGVEVPPRAPRKAGRLESFAPVDTWGKSTYPSELPKLRSQPTDLGEIRTWKAGKLAAKVPPVAPPREFLAGRIPAAFTGPRGSAFEPETVSPIDAQPQLPALAHQVDEIKAEWAGADSQRMASLTAGFRFQALRQIPSKVDNALQPEQFQTPVQQPAYHWTPSGVVLAPQYAAARTGTAVPFLSSGTGEFVLSPADFHAPVLQPEHHWSPSQAMVVPEHAPVRTILRLPQSGSLVAETNGLEYLSPEGRMAEFSSARPEIGWAAAIPMRETWRSCPPAALANSFVLNLTAFDADFVPQAEVVLPAPPAWTFEEKFEAGRVAMPVWQSAPALAPARPMLSWTGDEEFQATVTMPGMPGTVLTVGRMGPSFGWEHESARVGVGPESCTAQDAVASEVRVQLQALRAKIGVIPSPTPLIVPEEYEALIGEGIALPKEDSAVAPAASAPRYSDFRARVRTGLPPGERCEYKDWARPRFDHSMIVTEPIAASRPALAEVHADMEQPYSVMAARFEGIGAVETAIAARVGAGPEAISFAGATCEFALAGWPKMSVATTAMPSRTLLGLRSTAAPDAFAGSIETGGPVRYSPVTLVVVPPPQFALLKEKMAFEERFAAQAPVTAGAPVRIRHTGYRIMGPFPKLPPCVPENPFVLGSPVFASALTDVPRQAMEQRQDLVGMPEFPIRGGLRLHPADYWAWPAIKAPHGSRVAADVAETAPPASGPVRRFGPGRAGLQTNLKSADGPRKGA